MDFHKNKYHDKPRFTKPRQPRPPNCRYYIEVRDGEDPMRAYRKIKKKMKDDRFIEEIKERQYYTKRSDKRQERLKKRRMVLQRLRRDADDYLVIGGRNRRY